LECLPATGIQTLDRTNHHFTRFFHARHGNFHEPMACSKGRFSRKFTALVVQTQSTGCKGTDMTEFKSRRPPAIVAWCDQQVVEILLTGLHPTPRLFPPLNEDAVSADLQASRLRQVAAAATLRAGPRARRLLSWCTNLWAEAVR
jgi:hypothetical protein